MSPLTEDVYNDSFWEGIDGVVNALDNVKVCPPPPPDSLHNLIKFIKFGPGGFTTRSHQIHYTISSN